MQWRGASEKLNEALVTEMKFRGCAEGKAVGCAVGKGSVMDW